LYEILKRDLIAQGRGVAGLNEAEICQKYLALPSTCGLLRDEATFAKQILPNLEQIRQQDRVISTA